MITTSPGIVLSRRTLGESDRLAAVYARDLGRLSLRFVGVLRPRAKLRALSEPFVSADFRMFIRPASEYGKCIGGELRTVFPKVRTDFEKTLQAFRLCELMEALTPYRQPNPAKFDLLEQSLSLLGERGGDWLTLAYALRLLDLAGMRTPSPSAADEEEWARLHDEPLETVVDRPADEAALARFRSQLERQLASILDRPLKSAALATAHPVPS